MNNEENVTATECPHCGGWMLKICPDCDRSEFLARINNKQPAPIEAPASYGEPWQVTDGESLAVINTYGDYIQLQEDDFKVADGRLVIRAVQCVNACQGIADPVEALKLAKEALRWAAPLAKQCGQFHIYDFCKNALDQLSPP